MNALPNEITFFIIKQIQDVQSLVNMKISYKLFNTLISSFILNKAILNNNLFNYKSYTSLYNCCINHNCFWDTIDVYEDIYYQGFHRYCHFTQQALNNSTMTINKKIYNVNTPYCSECFTSFVLIGDNKMVKHNYQMNTINIQFL